MSDLSTYVLSVGIAALIVGILTSFTDNKSSLGVLTRMVCGLFLALTLIKPIGNLNYDDLAAFARSYESAGEVFAATGESLTNDALRKIIKQKTEAYILDKACSYNVQLEVQVTVGDGETPVPESVAVAGTVSPYVRTRLQSMIADELGIPKERQIWNG